MSRPPIIISNGGVLDLLANGLVEAKKGEEVDIEQTKRKIRDNVRKLINEDRDKTKIVIIKSSGKDAPCLFWYSNDETTSYSEQLEKYGLTSNQFDGKEGVSINEIVNDT